jgi:hypothetical protein
MKQKTGNILKVVIFSLLAVTLSAQLGNPIDDYSTKKHKLNHSGMAVLTAWSSVNLLSGAACFITDSEEEKYFYAMNSAWGLINFSIALPGFLGKKKQFKNKTELMKDQKRTEKIYRVNAVLDVVYSGAGFAMKEVAKVQQDTWRQNLFSGFGNSFIVQGSALFVFDVSMVTLNASLRKKDLRKIMENTDIAIRPYSVMMRYNF